MTAVAFKHSFKDKFRIFRDRSGVVSADIFDYLKGDHASRTVDVRVDMYSYPKELFDVYVVAHNCTDDTAQKAREAGAKVFEFNDPDKSRVKIYP